MELSNRSSDSRPLIRIAVIAALAMLLLGCKPDVETTGSTSESSVCAAKLYSRYDPKNFEQCVEVCLRCERGITTTCTTSCTLKGAR